MIIDTSAIVAILEREPERTAFILAMERADTRRMSVANWVELCTMVESRRGAAGLHDLDRLVRAASIELVALDADQGRVAREAFSRFGKGRHGAGLNCSECFAYALATVLGEPLLCKGSGFRQTDVLFWPPA